MKAKPSTLYKLLTTSILFLFIGLNSFSQVKCENQYKLLPNNNCAPCFTPTNQLPIAKLLLTAIPFRENENKIAQFIEASQSLQSIEYIVWGRDTLYFNMADEIKKAMAKVEGLQPENHMDGGSTNDHYRRMRAFDNAIKEAQKVLYYYCSILKTSPNQGYNNATIGSCNKGGELNQLLDQADDIMHLILELYKNNKRNIELDCCNPNDKPIDFHIQATTKLIQLLNAIQPYIDQLILVHELNLNSVAWFATNYNKFTGDISKDLARLRDISVGGLVADALVDNGFISKDDLDKLNKMMAEYEDMQSLKKAIENTFGEDVASVFGAMFGDFTIKDLRENFKDLVKKYPEKFKNLKKTAEAMPKASKFAKVFDAIGIAENSVQIFFDILIKLDGSGRIGYAQDIWWQKTQWFYLNSLTSLLNNAITVKTYNHLLNTLNSLMNSQQTLCLNGPKPKTKAEALQKLNQQLGMALTDGHFENGNLSYLIPTLGRRRIAVNIQFGDCYCGNTKDARPSEITPTNNIKTTEIIKTVIPTTEILKPLQHFSDSLTIHYFSNNRLYKPYDKIYTPPIRFALDVGYRFYNPKNGYVYFDIPNSTWKKTITDSTTTDFVAGFPRYSTKGNALVGFTVDYLLKKNSSLSINLQYNKTDWTINSFLNYSIVTFACPTCPPETKNIQETVAGNAAQQELNFGLAYFYYNTATVGPLIGLGLNASYKQTHAPDFPLRELDGPFNSPQNSFYFGGLSSLGLEWKINARFSIACLHSLRIMAKLKPEHQAAIRLSTRL